MKLRHITKQEIQPDLKVLVNEGEDIWTSGTLDGTCEEIDEGYYEVGVSLYDDEVILAHLMDVYQVRES